MPKGISLMAVVQTILVVYMALGLALQISLRYKIGRGMEDGPPSLARTVRDYAPALFLIPIGWAMFAFRRWKQNDTDLKESGLMMASGLAVALALLFLALLATLSVWLPGSLVGAIPAANAKG